MGVAFGHTVSSTQKLVAQDTAESCRSSAAVDGRFAATYGDLAGCLGLSAATHVVTTPSVLAQCDAGPVALHCLEVSPKPSSRVHPRVPPSYATLVPPPSRTTLVTYSGPAVPLSTFLVHRPLTLAPPAQKYCVGCPATTCSVIESSRASFYT